MNSLKEAQYRLTLARGYAEEAEQLANNRLWRASVSSAQPAVENAAKVVLALFRPIINAHDLSDLLLSLIEGEKLDEETSLKIKQIAFGASRLGFREYILTDYGDELTLTPPWEIYTEQRAKSALAAAKEALPLPTESSPKWKRNSRAKVGGSCSKNITLKL